MQFIGSIGKSAPDRGLIFWQTKSNADILNDSVSADCLDKVENSSTGELLYQKVDFIATPHLPLRITLKSARAWQPQHRFLRAVVLFTITREAILSLEAIQDSFEMNTVNWVRTPWEKCAPVQDQVERQFIGSIGKVIKNEDSYFGRRRPMPSSSTTQCQPTVRKRWNIAITEKCSFIATTATEDYPHQCLANPAPEHGETRRGAVGDECQNRFAISRRPSHQKDLNRQVREVGRKCWQGLCKQLYANPYKQALIAELESNHIFSPFSEESKNI